MSLIIDTFIIKDKNIRITDIDNIDSSVFFDINDYSKFNKDTLDFDYLEGAIKINYNNQELLGFKEWDLVDQLWDYFVKAINELKDNDYTQFLFPDQPFKVSLEKNKNDLILNLNERKTILNAKEFFFRMLEASIIFYNNLLLIFPEYDSFIKDSLETAKKVKEDYEIRYFNKK